MSILQLARPSGDAPLIRVGDLVVVYERFDSMKAVTITANGVYNNKFGNFNMSDWIGRPFGGRVVSKAGTGWLYLLAPTAELWTMVLRHRTQILYIADIATICFQMDLRPGSVVLESGTGSGSLTTSLVRAVAPTGHVHTFEFHELRADQAREEFQRNGLATNVTVEVRNVETDGFPDRFHGCANAVFLDLPGPWRAVPSAAKCLVPDGVICTFSPCIEQVQRTVADLNAHGFRDFKTIEILLRDLEVVADKAVAGRQELAEMLQAQVAQTAGAAGARGNRGSKRAKVEANGGGAGAAAGAAAVNGCEEERAAEGEQQMPPPPQQQKKPVFARPVPQGRGHTGYLTFARKAV